MPDETNSTMHNASQKCWITRPCRVEVQGILTEGHKRTNTAESITADAEENSRGERLEVTSSLLLLDITPCTTSASSSALDLLSSPDALRPSPEHPNEASSSSHSSRQAVVDSLHRHP
jgi:hypothetical protein